MDVKKAHQSELLPAEREGFEPSVAVVPLRRFSKPVPSATRPPLHKLKLFCLTEALLVSSSNEDSKISNRWDSNLYLRCNKHPYHQIW